MALRYLLDTNICIYALSGRHPALMQRLDRLTPGRAAMPIVVAGELHYGIAKSVRREDALLRLEALQLLIPVHQLPDTASEHYGEIRAELERAGTPIGNNDVWIAAHARASGLVLVSNNTREFGRVSGLRLENWMP